MSATINLRNKPFGQRCCVREGMPEAGASTMQMIDTQIIIESYHSAMCVGGTVRHDSCKPAQRRISNIPSRLDQMRQCH